MIYKEFKNQRGEIMAYVRQRGNQLAIVQGERDPENRKVQQRILFTIYSKAEALKIIGNQDDASSRYFQSLMEFQYPGLRFDWKKIKTVIQEKMAVLPDLYNYKTMRLQSQFRKDLSSFAKQLILNDPQDLLSSAKLIQENHLELEYLAELIQWRLKLKDQKESEWNVDNQFYWRKALQGNLVPPEAEEQAEAYYEKGEHSKAIAAFKLLIECFHDYAEGYNYLGLIALEQEQLKEAENYFREAMSLGRKKFSKRLARKHYWTDHSTRPYMRGMRNLVLTLNWSGQYEEALSYCKQLEQECGDDISAASYRAAIYLNLGYWQLAADTALYLHKLHPDESLIASFALFEMNKCHEALLYFVHGTLNDPFSAKMILGLKTPEPETHEEYRNYNHGISMRRSLHQFRKKQSRDSRQFFKTLINHKDIKNLLNEYKSVREKWSNEQTGSPGNWAFMRMQEITSFEFAQQVSVELEEMVI
jgi:tetratricopeptide (TPR) repeat protein